MKLHWDIEVFDNLDGELTLLSALVSIMSRDDVQTLDETARMRAVDWFANRYGTGGCEKIATSLQVSSLVPRVREAMSAG